MIKILSSLLFVFFGLGVGVHLRAQSTFTFTGTVNDSAGRPVPGVQVRIAKAVSGTLTDAEGRFSLTHTEERATLTFSSIGFETVSVAAEADSKRPVRIILQAKAKNLNEIPIVSERVQKLNAGVWDYTFWDEYIVLLKYYENSARSKLVFMDYDRKEVTLPDVPKNTTGLFRDCIGMVHLLTEDSAYQIEFNMGHLSLVPLSTRPDFEQGTRACVDEDPQYLYVMRKEGSANVQTDNFKITTANHTLRYYRLDRLDRSHKLLVTISDERIEKERKDRERYYRHLAGKGPRNPKMSTNDEEALTRANPMFKSTPTANPNITRSDNPYQTVSPDGNAANDRQPDSSGVYASVPKLAVGGEDDVLFLETIIFKEIYAPLFCINGQTSVFDCVHDLLLQYNTAGEKVSETPIDFHKAKGWQRIMLEDARTHRIYAVFRTEEGYELRETDARLGTVKGSYPVPYKYVENIKVHGGYIYFLYRTDMDALTTYLSRIRIM